MEKKLAEILSGHIVSSGKDLNKIVKQLREELPENEFDTYMKKLSHIMALNFDVLDLIGEKHPELNPYENTETKYDVTRQRIKDIEEKALKLIHSNKGDDQGAA